MSARAAQAILDGLAGRRDEVVIGKAAWLWRIYRLFPLLAHRFMRRMSRSAVMLTQGR
ncbi:hypothetical protein [Pseudooceanicola sp.]|uniref:hypothetical protein n=1 Tax=Pseudooceanicola sp. TaxID=1914328 RepID=UPI00262B8366|nr:hypothetical protein [Pseudooceanicola sp.]MDF1855010.1 hypothetical protein [Pseudooceanicola sp.]